MGTILEDHSSWSPSRMHAVISCTILEENLDEVSRIGVLEHAVSLRNISHSIVIISPIYMELIAEGWIEKINSSFHIVRLISFRRSKLRW